MYGEGENNTKSSHKEEQIPTTTPDEVKEEPVKEEVS